MGDKTTASTTVTTQIKRVAEGQGNGRLTNTKLICAKVIKQWEKIRS